MIQHYKRHYIIVIIVFLLLLIPFIAMQFTNEVNWTFMDFAIAGILLLSAGLAIEFILRKIPNRKHRIVICVLIFILLLLLWAELAVGVFGTLIAGN